MKRLLFAALAVALAPAPAAAATLYYNGAGGADWATLGSWWQDAGFSVPAAALPTSGDDAVVSAPVTSNSGDAIAVGALTVKGTAYLSVDASASGGAIFQDVAFHYAGTLVASTTFQTGTHNHSPVTGSAWFNGDAYNQGAVSGVGTFSGSSSNRSGGSIGGDATFAGTSRNLSGGTVSGNATFNTTAGNSGTVSGDATFNGGVNSGAVSGAASFAAGTQNQGHVYGVGTFAGDAINLGVVSGEAYFSGTSRNDATAGSTAYFSGTSRNNGTVQGDAYFRGASYNNVGTVVGRGYFFDQSYNGNNVNGNARFLGTSRNDDEVFGAACFAPTATNNGVVSGAVTVCDEVAPTFSGATADGAALVLAYDEALDASSTPATSAFTVTVAGAPATVSGVSVSGALVTLSLATPAASGQAVTVAYAVPGSNPVRDVSTNPAAAISPAASAVNQTPPAGGSSQGSVTVSVRYGSSSGSGAAASGPSREATTTPSDVASQATSSPAAPTSAAQLSGPFLRDLHYGSVGEDVRALQAFLNGHGFVLAAGGAGAPGEETAYFVDRTRAALVRFQLARGIRPAAGYFGPVTRALVNAILAGE